jgi:hypothetical protein
VDVQTGEVFSQEQKGQRPQPSAAEWNGDFDATSAGAAMTRATYPHWWPRAYTTTPLPRPPGVSGRLVYDRLLLRRLLAAEVSKASRAASSWRTSGVLNAALGNWLGAVDDLSRAVGLARDNDEVRYYHGLVSLIIRDFPTATKDFVALSPQFKNQADDGLKNVEILKGERKKGIGSHRAKPEQ